MKELINFTKIHRKPRNFLTKKLAFEKGNLGTRLWQMISLNIRIINDKTQLGHFPTLTILVEANNR